MSTVNANARSTRQEFSASALQGLTVDSGLHLLELRGWQAIQADWLSGKLEPAWDELLDKDSVSGFYQTPLWALTWYRHFHDEFEPLLILAKESGVLVGLAALAIEKSSGKVLFAGDPMADYRDFVCVDGRRRELVAAFLSKIIEAGRGSVFVLGQTQPNSETTGAAEDWAKATGAVRTIRRSHPCWRFRIGSSEEIEEQFKKRKTIRQAVSFYNRNGGMALQRVRQFHEWDELKAVYFQQECLRRAFAERSTTFDDSRKQALHEDLFKSGSDAIHFSVLRAGSRLISFMFCFVFRGVLYYGTPSFDPTESKRSPGILHILEVIRQCSQEGVSEVDLTLGTSSFKQRLGNHCVMLPSLYIYRSAWAYRKAWVRRMMAGAVKRVAGSHGEEGEQASSRWSSLVELLKEFRRQPMHRMLRRGLGSLSELIIDRHWERVYVLNREGSILESDLAKMPNLVVRTMQLADYLDLPEPQKSELPRLLQTAVRRMEKGHTLHTVFWEGRLVAHGWSCRSSHVPVEGALGVIAGGDDSIWLYDVQSVNHGKTTEVGVTPERIVRSLLGQFDGLKGALYLIVQSKVEDLDMTARLLRAGFSPIKTVRSGTLLGMKYTR